MASVVPGSRRLRSQASTGQGAAGHRQAVQREPAPVTNTSKRRTRADTLSDERNEKNVVTCEKYASTRGNYGLVRNTYTSTPYGPIERLVDSRFPDEILSLGRHYCSSHIHRLDELEAIIKSMAPNLRMRVLPRKPDGKVDKEALTVFDDARMEYRSLLFDIILEAVNHERQQDNPDAQAFGFSLPGPCELESEIVTPEKNTKLVYDHENNTPAMLLYFHPERVADHEYISYFGGFSHPHMSAVALQMKLHNKLSFQGIGCDGLLAQVTMARVRRADDHLEDHKTDMTFAIYSLPYERVGFVADMVQLLQNHKDFRKLYTTTDRTGRWSKAKGGEFVIG